MLSLMLGLARQLYTNIVENKMVKVIKMTVYRIFRNLSINKIKYEAVKKRIRDEQTDLCERIEEQRESELLLSRSLLYIVFIRMKNRKINRKLYVTIRRDRMLHSYDVLVGFLLM